ncbi:hypothetical protein [Listeria phage LMTA-148]|uniref:Uncharacterized protein n=2 Tax=Pecentumvirus TaxID=1857844 RepID=A0A068CBZ2_9CAUD|nr:hypothetical protein AG2_117 [Listeria phage vB_LmoM_AG20]YP_009055720.1 hypothetical protein LD12_gp112 [Listeria phage LMTA-148]AFJ76053.1 hypothetical protein AG2_117 [Listeria phage vB_LmoM_AG20]AID17409.1 hypothetical protein [Listeria phage LMTA-148]
MKDFIDRKTKVKVFDKRFNVWYTCPKCTGKLLKIEEEN